MKIVEQNESGEPWAREGMVKQEQRDEKQEYLSSEGTSTKCSSGAASGLLDQINGDLSNKLTYDPASISTAPLETVTNVLSATTKVKEISKLDNASKKVRNRVLRGSGEAKHVNVSYNNDELTDRNRSETHNLCESHSKIDRSGAKVGLAEHSVALTPNGRQSESDAIKLQDSCEEGNGTKATIARVAAVEFETLADGAITKSLSLQNAEQGNFVYAESEGSLKVLQEPKRAEAGMQKTLLHSEPGTSQNPTTDGVIADTNGKGGIEVLCEGKKTELEREMELYEAFERDEQARLLLRDQRDMQKEEEKAAKEPPNDKKRAPEGALQERQKKQSRRVHAVDEKSRDEEDVCFICFDGGDLVLCDRRSCPKAYHLGCIGRDEAFFTKKGAWFCGWHFCAICTKSGNYQCYTCPTAYCGNCVSQADFRILRKRKGLCEECLPIVSLIERNETVNNDGVEVDFEDRETYEYLFKDYWIELREKLSITLPHLDGDGNAVEETGIDGSDTEAEPSDNEESGPESDKDPEELLKTEDEHEHVAQNKNVRRKLRKKRKASPSKSESPEEDMEPEKIADRGNHDQSEHEHEHGRQKSRPLIEGWASKELKDFIEHMKEDVTKPLTRFAVHKLLWTYIKQHKLQNPRKMSEINCDTHLRIIFGKDSVGQFEMFKLLNRHFPSKASVVTPNSPQRMIMGADEHIAAEDIPAAEALAEEKSRQSPIKIKRKGRKNDEKFARPDSNEYAAVTYKNISLIYLRRALLEEFLNDPDFDSKVVDTFVRIRVPGNCKMDTCYRLVLVTGTGIQRETYKTGAKMTNVTLIILNLQKKESIAIELVSNQDFTEEECQRLRLNIKCGFIKTLTVGQLEEKAISLQEAKVNDWFENERQRLVNLRDRASEKGRKRELRECVEKLQELNNPAFRAAKMHARPEVAADPHMDPGYESDAGDGDPTPDITTFTCRFGGIAADTLPSPAKIPPHTACSAGPSWGGSCTEDPKHSGRNRDKDRYRPNNSSSSTREDTNRRRDPTQGPYEAGRAAEKLSLGPDWNARAEEAKGHQSDEGEKRRNWEKEFRGGRVHDRGMVGDPHRWRNNGQWGRESTSFKFPKDEHGAEVAPVIDDPKTEWGGLKGELVVTTVPNAPGIPDLVPQLSTPALLDPATLGEQEKLWHYMDPSGTIQGPFSIEQLRKWKGTGLFPVDLRTWRTNEGRESSILLTDALDGKFGNERVPWTRSYGSDGNSLASASTAMPKLPTAWHGETSGLALDDGHVAGSIGRRDSTKPVELVQSSHALDLNMVNLDGKEHQGSRWGSSRAGFCEAASIGGRPEDWSAPRSWRDDDGWDSGRTVGGGGGGESSGWAVHAGRKDVGRSSRVNHPGWELSKSDASDGRDGSHSSRGQSGSKKDIPCRFHMQGYCRKGGACGYWHK